MVCEEWIQGGQRWRHQLGGCCSPPGENDQAGLSHGHGKEDLDDGSDWLGRPAHLPKWGGVGSRDQGLLTVVRKPGGAAGLRCQVGKTHDSVPSEWVTQIPDGHSHPQQWLCVNWAGPSS